MEFKCSEETPQPHARMIALCPLVCSHNAITVLLSSSSLLPPHVQSVELHTRHQKKPVELLKYVFICVLIVNTFKSQVKEAMQRIHDRGNIGKLILDVEKSPTPLVSVH